MPLSSKLFTESTRKQIVKIDQYLAKIWTKCNSLLFGSPSIWRVQFIINNVTYRLYM